MKKCITYYMYNMFTILIFTFGVLLMILGSKILPGSELIFNKFNIFQLFSFVFTIIVPLLAFTGGNYVEKYYKVEVTPASEFEFVEYLNMYLLKLKNLDMAWIIYPYQKKMLMHKLDRNEDLKIKFFYNRKKEQLRDQLVI